MPFGFQIALYRLQYQKSNCIARNLKSLSFKDFKLVKCGTKVKYEEKQSNKKVKKLRE